MKKYLFILLVLSLAVVTTQLFSQDKSAKKPSACSDIKMEKSESQSNVPWNKVCPVKGNQIDSKVTTVKYNGKNYGFCCSGCDSDFKKDPAKFSKNLSKDGTKFLAKK